MNSFYSWKALRTIILFLALFPLTVSPFLYTVEDNHWLGSEAAYDYWTANHFQWGKEIIQNIGPLGFIHFPLSFTGYLDYENALANFALSAVLVILVIYISSLFPSKIARIIFLSIFAFFNSAKKAVVFSMPSEVNHYLLPLLIAYVLFLSPPYLVICFLLATLAAMSLGKGMFIFVSSIIVGMVALHYLFQKKTFLSLLIMFVYMFSVVVFWVLAGQDIANFYDFVKGSIAFSSGYNDSMVRFDTPWQVVVVGAFLFLICAKVITAKNWRDIKRISNAEITSRGMLAFIEMFILFAAWKHGVVSGDEYHLLVYLLFAIMALIPFMYILPRSYNSATVPEKSSDSTLKVTFNNIRTEIIFLTAVIALCPAFFSGWKFIFFLNETIAIEEIKLQASKEKMQLPRMKSFVKNETVGYFGELPAPMMYNDFSYKAQPSTISFAAWDRWIIKKDADFFENNAIAPAYLLYHLYNVADGSIARQFSPLDSVKAQLEIFRRYDPVRDVYGNAVIEQERLLLKRRKPLTELQYEHLETHTYTLDDWIQVPEGASEPIQVLADLPSKVITQITAIIYKNPSYYIEYKFDDGTGEKRKFVPTKGREGFLITPLILTNADFLAALSKKEWKKYKKNEGSSLKKVTGFRIVCEHLQFACAEKVTVEFRKVEGLEFGRENK